MENSSLSFVVVPSKKLKVACRAALIARERERKERLESRIQFEMNLRPSTWWEEVLQLRLGPAKTKEEAMKRFSKRSFEPNHVDVTLNNFIRACNVNQLEVSVSVDELWMFDKFYK